MTLRVFAVIYAALLMLSLAGMLTGYRYFVTIPDSRDAVDRFHEKELITLYNALQKEVSFLQTVNYDYSVWDESYDFVENPYQEFIEQNLLDDTFTSLKIDGIYYYDLELNQVFGKGFDHVAEEPIDFPELNLKRNTQLSILFPDGSKTLNKVPVNGGFINTSQGPAMFASTVIRRSNRDGPTRGMMIFVRKVRPVLIHSLQTISQLNLSSHIPTAKTPSEHIPVLVGSLHNEHFTFKRQRLLTGPMDEPVMVLNIEHQSMVRPTLFDQTTLLSLLMLTLIPLAMMLFVHTYLINPVTKGAGFIRQMIESKKFIHIVNNYSIKELQELSDDFNELINVVNQQQQALEDLILTDGLTGISNRRAFEQFMKDSWSRMQRSKKPLTLIMCDIDFFKPYNDNYGHQAGDKALISVAQALDRTLKRSGDLIARYGGEEFALVLADSSSESLDKIVEQVLLAIRQLQIPHEYALDTSCITLSVGAAIVTELDGNPIKCCYEQFIKAADDALYQAKDHGRNKAIKVRFNALKCEAEFEKEIH